MAYAQKNYDQRQGIPSPKGNYKISAIGCFITAFSNLLLDYGQDVSPATIDNYLRDRNLYTDIDDGIRDDVGWGTVSGINGGVTVSRTVDRGTNRDAGWPNTNQSIVRFYYKSVQSGQMIFHFCKVADHAQQLIVDSWDGAVKKSPYGEPTAFAEYTHNQPQPMQPAGTAQPLAGGGGKKLFLPSAAGTWRVYPLNKSPVIGNEVGKLAVGSYPPGLTYDILGNPMPNIYRIKTETWGEVNIYAGKDTIAKFVDSAPAPTPPPAPQPVGPAPAPEPAPAKAPPEPPKQTNIVYSKLETPLNLIVNKDPTTLWALDFPDDVHATAVAKFTKGSTFSAYGKAQRTDGDKPCYYMTKNDFGEADTTGRPTTNVGINTVDLSVPAAAPALVINDNSGAPAAASTTDDDHVDVKVLPTDNWKTTFKVNSAGEYIANADTVVHDLDGSGPDEQLIRGQTVHVAGMFTKGGVDYYRTKKKTEAGLWYGIPIIALQESSLDVDGDIFNLDLADAIRHDMGKFSTKEKAIKLAGRAEAARFNLVKWLTSLFKRNK